MKKIYKIISVLMISSAVFFTPIYAQAADVWAAAAEAVGVLAMYKSTLASMLKLGNNVDAQMSARHQDIKQNGEDKNPRDLELVERIMTRLVNSANYELKANSLPFTWAVNNDEKFNASCYPMNYISINRGLLQGLNFEEDEIAAVLAHEMTHGILQHSAKSYAKAVAQTMGAMLIGMNIDSRSDSVNIDWGKMSGMVNYSIAKSIILPTEYEADEGGFFLMTSAGFNPGGGAAAMARMNYYVRYETRDFLEFDAHDKSNEQTFSDHPDTELREEKLAKFMTEYGMGHVTVKKADRNYKVFIDDTEIFTATSTSATYNNAAENAYFFSGGLAKAFHDLKSADEWNFHTGKANRIEFLTDDKVYNFLRENSLTQNLGEKIRAAVIDAYKNETPEVREKYFELEKQRENSWSEIKAETLNANKKVAKKLRVNADIYNDYGRGDLALKEISRAMEVESQDNFAECLAIRGRAKAVNGDYEGALADVDEAVRLDPKNLFNFLNRADVRHMRGEYELALADIEQAIQIDEKNAISYRLQGDIFDELGDEIKAEESYRMCYERTEKNPQSIPKKYLEKIDPKAAEKFYRPKENKKPEKKNKKSEKNDAEKNDTEKNDAELF